MSRQRRGWLRSQAEGLGDDVAFWGAAPGGSAADEDPLRRAGPHPLDLPTGEQGRALAALDSGRWTVEPGSHALVAHGEGPGPSDALGLVGELRARDWIAAEGEVTLVGRHALSRWLDRQPPVSGSSAVGFVAKRAALRERFEPSGKVGAPI